MKKRDALEDVPNYTVAFVDKCGVCGHQRSLTLVRVGGTNKMICSDCRRANRALLPSEKAKNK